MGFDVSYHPISEQEMNDWFFDVLSEARNENWENIEKLATQHEINPFYIEQYKKALLYTKQYNSYNIPFNSTYGHSLAIVQGFFRQYFYNRGSAFSFLIESYPEFKKYTKSWQEIIPSTIQPPEHEGIQENYSVGVFIPAAQVSQLLLDYQNNPEFQKILDEFYERNITVFINALKMAQELNVGLLEATDVIMPNPLDLNNSQCYSNLFNCDPTGALIYEEVAAEQINSALSSLPDDEKIDVKDISYNIVDNQNITKTVEPKKEGFFSRLLKKFKGE